MKAYETKRGCLKAGHFWNGFDISGHVFILIYSSLVLIEEARPIVGWDNIKEHLRVEDHNRKVQESSSLNPLRNLNNNEISTLRSLYHKNTPIIKLLFVAITVLQLLWDVMLVCTMLYYHRMVEKVVGGIIAIVTWYFTYRTWYPSKILPDAAGKGTFNYQQKAVAQPSLARRSSLLVNNKASTSSDQPKFMGRPIYQMPPKRDDLNVENSSPSTGKFDFQPPPPKFV